MEGMEGIHWLERISSETQIQQILETNQYTQKYGLVLSNEETKLLVQERSNTLKQERRVEFGEGILPKLIYAFCDSDFINQRNYCYTLIRLQETFYLYKNEMMDEITDDELIEFMREQFDNVCYGDFDYLEGTCLDIFAQAIRAGYRGYTRTGAKNEFEKFDIVARWDRELYQETLRELCWR